MNFNKTNNLIGWLLFLGSTVLYLVTLESTASYWDSGEFIAASYKLEIPHPPGAPLFLLIGRLWSMMALGEVQSVAFALNSLSAVTSGLAVMLLYWSIVMIAEKLIKKVSKETSPGLLIASGVVGALSFAFSDSFWTSATETEVYAFSIFLTALVFWAILKWEKKEETADQNRWLILIAYLMGLSVGVHLLNLLAIPALGLVYYFKKYKKHSIWEGTAALALSCLILVGILYGLVSGANLAKSLEVLFVNNFGLPFGSGAFTLLALFIGGWIYAIGYTQKRVWVNANTLVLALGFIMIGYSSYTLVMVRADNNPPINQNNPNNLLGLIYYLNMEQYGTRPLLYGKHFDASPIDQKQGKAYYEMGEGRYEVKDHKMEYIYRNEDQMFLPRMHSSMMPQHAPAYRRMTGLKKGEKPSFADNIGFMLSHQIGHMYVRYLLWNFAGKANGIEGASWLGLADSFEQWPDYLAKDQARNNYYMLPLFLGIAGLILLFRSDRKQLYVTGMLFIMTGLAIVVYINAPPVEPRERDYIYVGSYYAFCIWIGLGVISLFQVFKSIPKLSVNHSLRLASLTALVIPGILLFENFDDHDRSDRYLSIDQAKTMLASCDENAILFTGGDNDTYPLWYVQEVEGFRTDVRVIVMSYANADWYVNQMYRKVNESEALPLALSKENYKSGGLNDYLPLVKNSKINGAISAKQYLGLIEKESKALRASTGFGELNTTPSDSFYIHSDLAAVKSKVPERFHDLMTNKLEIKLKGKALEKKDLLILDLIDSNAWKRPIYFNFTSLNSVNFDFKKNVVQEGSAYQLLPLINPDDDSLLVDEKKMYDRLVTNGLWRDYKEDAPYYSDYYRSMLMNQRHQYNELARVLLDTGHVEKAKETIAYALEVFPQRLAPYDLSHLETTNILLTLGDLSTANHIADTLAGQSQNKLDFAVKTKDLGSLHTRRSLYTLRKLAVMYHRQGYSERSSEFAKLFEQYAEKLNS
ncbi:protein O-mannosyl-transferase family [Reichenbachiella sp.]|uniref:glycosyltransferase family 117 protein n=1 Tax=Reichenbachiella sp. TaxID=2184521 RepID=UPI003B5C5780